MHLIQSNLFKKAYKKLQKNTRHIVNETIKMVMENTEIGILKVGDLAGIRVHKFKHHPHMYLLAYEYTKETNTLYLIALGEHQNFYEKMKRHLT